MKKTAIFVIALSLSTIISGILSTNKDVSVIVTDRNGIQDTCLMNENLLDRVAPGQTVCMSMERGTGIKNPYWRILDGETIQRDTLIREKLLSELEWKNTLKKNVVIEKIIK